MKTEINDLNTPNQDNNERLNTATLANEISEYLVEPFSELLEVNSLASKVKLFARELVKGEPDAYFTVIIGKKTFKITVESED